MTQTMGTAMSDFDMADELLPEDTARTTAERFLSILHESGTWFEIRSLKCPVQMGSNFRTTASGYFDNPVMAAQEIDRLDRLGPPAVYVTLNPVSLAVTARASRRIKHTAETTTGDTEITNRRWLPIDIDSERPAGVSATEEEKAAAVTLAQRIANDLTNTFMWPEPLMCMSGNGAHLLYRVDLPNDAESASLIDRTLQGLGAKYDTAQAHVDKTMYNASRIVKVAGTMARKGDSTEERPHRRAELLTVPESLAPVPPDLLELVATSSSTRPARSLAEVPVQTPVRCDSTPLLDRSPQGVREYLEARGVHVKGVRERNGITILSLDRCPITGANGGSSVAVLVSEGNIGYCNKHDRGTGLTWHDLRRHIDPGYGNPSQSRDCGIAEKAEPSGSTPAPFSGIPMVEVARESVTWLWKNRIPYGKLTILDGDPGEGKTLLGCEIAAAVSSGRALPGHDTLVVPAGVVIVTLEDGLGDTIRARLEAAGADLERIRAIQTIPDSKGEQHIFTLPDHIPFLENAVNAVRARFVFIDPVMATLGSKTDSHKDQDVRRALAPLTNFADRTGAAVMILRHLNKAAGGHSLYRGGGSIGIIGSARCGLIVLPDPSDEGIKVLAGNKSNLGPMPPSLRYSISLSTSVPDAPCITWRGETTLTARDLLHAHDDSSPRDEAPKDFLRDLLAEGPVEAEQVHRAARSQGHGKTALNRAARALNVTKNKCGFQGRWMWSLPEESQHESEEVTIRL